MRRVRVFVPLVLALLPGCQRPAPQEPPDEGGATMEVSSRAFGNGETIPKEFTADGRNVSPPLRWSGAPPATQSYAVIVDDPDAPAGLWTHWVLFNIPADRFELPEAVPPENEVLDGALQGTNSFNKIGYGGPSPPKGKPHRYFFHVYALDRKLDLKAGASRAEVDAALKGHILAKGQWMGTYGR